jgi:phosphatidylethanolamine/phosphatidyl-N-methylethanolamine N-methyltransferase
MLTGAFNRIGTHLKAAMIDYRHVASPFPSSVFTARSVVRHVAPDCQTVVEYGPGTGVITQEILKRVSSSAAVVGVEISPYFSDRLQRLGDPRFRLIRGDITTVLPRLVAGFPEGVQTVVSGIPFSLMQPSRREEIISVTRSWLRADGRLIAYQATRSVLPFLERHFAQVECHFEPRGLPPILIMVARP